MTEDPEVDGKAPLDLSPDEKAILADLLQSDAWKIVERVHKWQAARLLTGLLAAKDDHRFHQGYAQGFKWATEILAQAIKVKQHRPATGTSEERLFNRYS